MGLSDYWEKIHAYSRKNLRKKKKLQVINKQWKPRVKANKEALISCRRRVEKAEDLYGVLIE